MKGEKGTHKMITYSGIWIFPKVLDVREYRLWPHSVSPVLDSRNQPIQRVMDTIDIPAATTPSLKNQTPF